MAMNDDVRPGTRRSGPAVPSAVILFDVRDAHATVGTVADHRLDQVRQVADAERHLGDAGGTELAEDELEDRRLADRHQRLREYGSERRQSGALAAGQHDSAKRMLRTS